MTRETASSDRTLASNPRGVRSRRAARTRFSAVAIGLALSVAILGCGGRADTVSGPTDPASGVQPFSAQAANQPTPVPRVAGPPQVFVGAGDIAMCERGREAEATARLLDGIDGTVFTLGDNAYQTGSAREYRECYDRSWGRHRARTRPVPGNHEYETPGATPYFDYFGLNAGPHGFGYYSFDLGNWHAIALNSNISLAADSPQGAWLRADLAANRTQCTIAYWHYPLFSSGQHGDQARMRDFWRVLYEAGADVVLSAHDHTYERFAPQDPDGVPDATHGIRQFVVGTGGAPPYAFTNIRPTSEVRVSALGVLKLTLRADDYDWNFIPVSGPGDSGTGTCH
jgi:3',5'-cyclic AMP phosphodiesterase CpdA